MLDALWLLFNMTAIEVRYMYFNVFFMLSNNLLICFLLKIQLALSTIMGDRIFFVKWPKLSGMFDGLHTTVGSAGSCVPCLLGIVYRNKNNWKKTNKNTPKSTQKQQQNQILPTKKVTVNTVTRRALTAYCGHLKNIKLNYKVRATKIKMHKTILFTHYNTDLVLKTASVLPEWTTYSNASLFSHFLVGFIFSFSPS